MKLPDFSQLNPNQRRQFLKLLTGLIALPAMPSVVRDSLIEAVVGAQAHAQAATPINFKNWPTSLRLHFGAIS